MPTWKLTLEYDGTRYHGWQEQPHMKTVMGELRKAAEDYFKSSVELSGAGRTDAGVHALAQVARLRTHKGMSAGELLKALNERLASDICLTRVEETRQNFHARHDARARYYVYQISVRRSAFAKKYVWWIKDQLDVDAMRQATRCLLGRHNFVAFSDKREDEKSTVLTVESAEIKVEGDLILFRIGASYFLWKMVRRIVGALVAVGRRRITVEQFAGLLKSNRETAPQIFDIAANTAPPSGLFLERIVYDASDQPPELTSVFPVKK